jgi:hypothetical protein
MEVGIPSACALPWLSTAQGEEGRLYFKGDLGGSLTCDSEGSIRASYATGPRSGSFGFEARFDPGERAGVACGYQITDWFAAEGEMGAMVNQANGAGLLDGTFANARSCLT